MRIRFLFDENLDPRFLRTMQRHYPEIDVLRVMYRRTGRLHDIIGVSSSLTRTLRTSVWQMPYLCTGIPQNWKTGKIKLSESLLSTTAGI